MIFNIDFDGTCVTHDFPEIGKEIGAIPVLKSLIENGHQLILFTMRSDRINGENFLTQAVNWFEKYEIPLYGIQSNPGQKEWTDSPKSYANYIIDDTCIFSPLMYEREISNRKFLDWISTAHHLAHLDIIKPEDATKTQRIIDNMFYEHKFHFDNLEDYNSFIYKTLNR